MYSKNPDLNNLISDFIQSSAVAPKAPTPSIDIKNIHEYIDHTLLKPEATIDQIEKLCLEVKEFGFKSACVQPYYVQQASQILKGSQSFAITVVGFPLGANITEVKVQESKLALANSAKEIDMVINLSALKSKNIDYVFNDISSVVRACDPIPVKVIVETALLTTEEKVICCALILKSGAAFIKTSTGFASKGAELEDILLFKHLLKDRVKIKASGGIKNREQALRFIAAGANRLGTSSGVEIIKNQISTKAY
jgi:deoxyribose-phosphate aldolase